MFQFLSCTIHHKVNVAFYKTDEQIASITVLHGVTEAENSTWLEIHREKISYGILQRNFLKKRQNPFSLHNTKVTHFKADFSCKYDWEINWDFQLFFQQFFLPCLLAIVNRKVVVHGIGKCLYKQSLTLCKGLTNKNIIVEELFWLDFHELEYVRMNKT